jgi:hypothetical protein
MTHAGRAPAGRRTTALAWGAAALATLALVPVALLSGPVNASPVGTGSGPASPLDQAVVSTAVVVATMSAALMGALLASRRPRNPVGWLLLASGLVLILSLLVELYVKYGLVARPGSLPGARQLVGLGNGSPLSWLTCAGFVLLLTPTGSLPSARWRWWAWVAAVAPLVPLLGGVVEPSPLSPDFEGNPLAVPALARVLVVPAAIATAVVLAGLLLAAWSLVGRFRRARGNERLQLRWLALAGGVAAVLLLVAMVAAFLGRDAVVFASLAIAVTLLPLSTGAAILRYRLYDLDRIISRTVAYALLTVLLGLGYTGVVLGLGQLAPHRSSLGVAVATLVVAALFQPARRRVQRLVDRRFNRRRYDAAITVQAFSDRLRQQIDLENLTGELLAVVEQTVQPTSASLWLRPPRRVSPGG